MELGRHLGGRLHGRTPSSPLAFRQRSKARLQADELLLAGAEPDGSLVAERAAQLTSPRTRTALARSIDATVRELEGRVVPSAVPLNRAGGRPQVELLSTLAARLRAPEPVTPRGVLLVEKLLTDGLASPLYNRDRTADLEPTLLRCASALEPRDRVAA